MTTTLNPSPDTAYGRRTATNNNDIVGFGLSIDIAPSIRPRDLERAARPTTFGASSGRMESLLEGDAIAEMSNPDLEAAMAFRSAKHIMPGILHHEANVQKLGNGNGK